jgi:hypothetical protein
MNLKLLWDQYLDDRQKCFNEIKYLLRSDILPKDIKLLVVEKILFMYAHEFTEPGWYYFTDMMAGHGYINALKWAAKRNFTFDYDAPSFGASGGHLKCLKWLKDYGCEWNSDVCSNATIEIKSWLNSLNGKCPCGKTIH